MAAFDQEGAFAKKKVAVVGDTSDQAEIDLVLPQLKSLKVDVVQTAINSVPDTDQASTDSEFAYRTEVPVCRRQRCYRCRGRGRQLARSAAGQPEHLLTQVDRPGLLRPRDRPGQQDHFDWRRIQRRVDRRRYAAARDGWNDPAMRRCVATVHAAEPDAVINDPVTAASSTPVTWDAPENACQVMALFEDIVKAAGKTLNNATFNQAGESLTHITIPGGGGIYDFGGGHRDGDGPVFVYEWNAAAKNLEPKATIG